MFYYILDTHPSMMTLSETQPTRRWLGNFERQHFEERSATDQGRKAALGKQLGELTSGVQIGLLPYPARKHWAERPTPNPVPTITPTFIPAIISTHSPTHIPLRLVLSCRKKTTNKSRILKRSNELNPATFQLFQCRPRGARQAPRINAPAPAPQTPALDGL
jgi:hypothetical protein